MKDIDLTTLIGPQITGGRTEPTGRRAAKGSLYFRGDGKGPTRIYANTDGETNWVPVSEQKDD